MQFPYAKMSDTFDVTWMGKYSYSRSQGRQKVIGSPLKKTNRSPSASIVYIYIEYICINPFNFHRDWVIQCKLSPNPS